MFFISLVCFVIFEAMGQNKINFSIVHSGKNIGELTAEKTQEGKHSIYKSKTTVSYHLLVTIKVVHNNEVVFDNGLFQNSIVHSQIGKHKKNEYLTRLADGKLLYSINGSNERELKNIKTTVTQLFFEEPIAVQQLYSAEKGEFHSLELIEKGVYSKKDTKGNKNTYYYNNGKLKKIEIETNSISFSMLRIE